MQYPREHLGGEDSGKFDIEFLKLAELTQIERIVRIQLCLLATNHCAHQTGMVHLDTQPAPTAHDAHQVPLTVVDSRGIECQFHVATAQIEVNIQVARLDADGEEVGVFGFEIAKP